MKLQMRKPKRCEIRIHRPTPGTIKKFKVHIKSKCLVVGEKSKERVNLTQQTDSPI